MSRVFAPPHQAYQVRSRFLSSRQGKKELSDYTQELRTLLAAMQLDPLPEEVRVNIFMEGLRTGVARTEVFRVHLSTFEEAVDIALNAEFNFKAARYGTHGHAQSSFDKAEPMDLSYADDDEAGLQAVKMQSNIRRFYTCGSTKHIRPNCLRPTLPRKVNTNQSYWLPRQRSRDLKSRGQF